MPMLMLNKKREGERQERVFVIDKEMGEREWVAVGCCDFTSLL